MNFFFNPNIVIFGPNCQFWISNCKFWIVIFLQSVNKKFIFDNSKHCVFCPRLWFLGRQILTIWHCQKWTQIVKNGPNCQKWADCQNQKSRALVIKLFMSVALAEFHKVPKSNLWFSQCAEVIKFWKKLWTKVVW